MVWLLVGTIAGICSSIGFIPQIIQGIRTKSLSDISPITVILTLTSSSLWLAYGIHINNFTIMASNASIASLALTVLLLRFLFKPEFVHLKRKILSISLRYRLVLFFILLMLLPFVILRASAYPRMQADLREAVIQHLDGVVYKQVDLITNWIEERIKIARTIANNPQITQCPTITKEDKDYSDIVQYLEIIKHEYGYRGILISNDKGSVTVATMGESIGSNIVQKDYFHGAIKGDAFISGIIPSDIPLINEQGDEESDLPVLFISTPMKDREGKITGVVALRIDTSRLNDFMRDLRLGKTGDAYLVNQDGYMVTESRFAKYYKKEGLIKKRCALEFKVGDQETGILTEGTSRCISGTKGFNANGYINPRGIVVLGAWRWLPSFCFGIIAEIDRKEGYGAAYNLDYLVKAVLLILIFPCALIAYLAGRKISAPIIELTRITKKMSAGDLSQRIELHREDEIGDLAGSFNTMAKSLDEKTQEIIASEQRYRKIFNSIREGIYQSEPGAEGVFTFINKAGAEILGYSSPEEIIGTKVKNIYVDQEDRRRLCEKLERDGIWREFVSLCKRKNGESFYVERTSSLLRDKKGNPIAIYGVFRDISERKKAEIKIVESEKRYRLLFDSLKEGVYQSEPEADGVFLWINQAGTEILGYESSGEVIGTSVKDIYINPDDRKKVVEKLQKDGIWKEFISFCKKKNGKRFYMERTSSLVTNDGGNPVRIDGIFRDITERKIFEEELQISEKHYRELLNSLKDGIYQCEPTEDGVFTWINQAGAEILGYSSPQEVIGMKVKNIYVNTHDGKELLKRLEEKGVWKDFISYCKKKNCERFISENTCNLVRNEDGKPIRVECVFRNVSER